MLGLDSLNLVIVNISNFCWRQTGLNQYNRRSLWEVDIHYCVMELYNIIYRLRPREKSGTKERRHIGSPRLINFVKFCIWNWEWCTSEIITYWYRESKSIGTGSPKVLVQGVQKYWYRESKSIGTGSPKILVQGVQKYWYRESKSIGTGSPKVLVQGVQNYWYRESKSVGTGSPKVLVQGVQKYWYRESKSIQISPTRE